jgi:hypothetical protein
MKTSVRAHWVTLDGYQAVRGKDCIIYLEPRGFTCDRGRFFARLGPDVGSKLDRDIGPEDAWPRYYFDETRAKLEIEAWLVRRDQFVEESAEQATARILAQLERENDVFDLLLNSARQRSPR